MKLGVLSVSLVSSIFLPLLQFLIIGRLLKYIRDEHKVGSCPICIKGGWVIYIYIYIYILDIEKVSRMIDTYSPPMTRSKTPMAQTPLDRTLGNFRNANIHTPVN